MQEKRRKFVKNVLNNRINKKEYVTYDKKKHGSTEKDSESVYEEKRSEILKIEESAGISLLTTESSVSQDVL